MSEWKEIPLSKTTRFIVDNRGRTAPTELTGIPLIATNCISNNNLYPIYENLRYVSSDTYETWFRSHPEPGDIILTLKGSQNGAVCLVPNPVDFVIAQDMVALRVDENVIDRLFLFAALRSPEVQVQIKNLDVSGVIPHLKKSDFDKLLLPYPDRKVQESIGQIYISLSNKIDLLHRQNATLETMAETLFRQWFEEEVKEDWVEVSLKDYISIKHGYAFKGNYISTEPTNLILVTPGNFKIGGGFKFDKFKYYTNENFPKDYIFKAGDLIVTMTDLSVDGNTLGYPAFVPENYSKEVYLHNQRVGKVEFINEIGKYFLHQLMKTDDYQWFVLGGASGTAIRHTSPTSICNYSFRMPPKSKILEFETFANGLEEKNKKNQIQIRTLTALRDTLLPKLMSGEVRVEI